MMNTRQDSKKRSLADHRQADNGCFHSRAIYRGTSTWVRISSIMRSAVSARRGTIVVRKDPEWQLYLFPDKPATLARFRQLRDGKIKNLRF